MTKKRRMVQLKTGAGQTEWKWFDDTMSSTASIVNGTVIDSICKIPQGTNVSERIGNKITVKSISLRGYSYLDQQTTQLSNGLVRIILFIDKQSVGYTASVSDVLAVTDFISHVNLHNSDRFIILKDKVFDIELQTCTTASTEATWKPWQIYTKVNVDVDYAGSAAAIPTVNNIGVLLIASGNWVNGAIASTRVRYIDK